MPIDRRHLLVAGSSLGLATLLYGCGGGSNTSGEANAATPEAAPAAGGEVELYDGSPIEPIDGDAINNPDGFADRPLGGVNARVTVIEYVSPTCPHCAAFHVTAFPTIKEKYIDTGLIRFILRPFRRNELDLATLILAEASGNSYHDMLSAFLKTQSQWATAANPRDAIFQIAQQFGFTQETFTQALTDPELFAGVESLREQALSQFGLQGTPTFYINGKRLETSPTVETLSAEIDSRL